MSWIAVIILSVIAGAAYTVIRIKLFGLSEADRQAIQRAEDAARQRRARVDDDEDEYLAEEQRRQSERWEDEFLVSYNNGDYN